MSRELHARLRLSRPGFEFDVDLTVPGRGLTGIFGPSGAGKSTLLRSIAGLERSVHGEVRLGDEVWQDDATRRFVAVHRRRVGFVFQEPALFEHLNVRKNLRYGFDRAPERQIAWDDAIAWLGLRTLLERMPSDLSGGEKQRVAIGRALLSSPRLMLMDEPLSALDEKGRRQIFPYLEEITTRLDLPILYVSHSLDELARLADRLVRVESGSVRQVGDPASVMGGLEFAAWRGDAAASLAHGTVEEHDDRYSLTRIDSSWGDLWVRQQDRPIGTRLRVQVRASDVSIALGYESESSLVNQFPMVVAAMKDSGEDVLVRLIPIRAGADDTASADREAGEGVLLARVTRRSRDHLRLEPGMQVWARVKSVAVV